MDSHALKGQLRTLGQFLNVELPDESITAACVYRVGMIEVKLH